MKFFSRRKNYTSIKVTVQLASDGGNLILIGPPGSGRRTTVQLGAYYLNISVLSPPVGVAQTDKSIVQFFRNALGQASVENKKVVLLIESHHMMNGLIFVNANNLLSQGSVPGIWTAEEIEQSTLKGESMALGKSAMELFTSRSGSAPKTYSNFCNFDFFCLIKSGSNRFF